MSQVISSSAAVVAQFSAHPRLWGLFAGAMGRSRSASRSRSSCSSNRRSSNRPPWVFGETRCRALEFELPRQTLPSMTCNGAHVRGARQWHGGSLLMESGVCSRNEGMAATGLDGTSIQFSCAESTCIVSMYRIDTIPLLHASGAKVSCHMRWKNNVTIAFYA